VAQADLSRQAEVKGRQTAQHIGRASKLFVIVIQHEFEAEAMGWDWIWIPPCQPPVRHLTLRADEKQLLDGMLVH
jgi:hypothetical protein